jgi:hypothetical protein
MHPRHVPAVEIAAVGNHTATGTANCTRVPGRNCRQQRLAKAVNAKWARHLMNVNLREPDEIGRYAVCHEMHRAIRLPRKIGRKRVVRGVHPAERDEVT